MRIWGRWRRGLAVACAMAVLWVVPAARADDSAAAALDHLSVHDRRIVDESGRTVMLRGVNVNQLGDYFHANPEVPATLPLSEDDFARIAALGMNTVRLLVHWSRLEPEPGVHDTEYLAEISQAVDWAAAHGIYVILDMHQDAWGKHIATAPGEQCVAPFGPSTGWDGAPEWATYTDGLSKCSVVQREISPAVAMAFQSFWLDRPGPDGVGIQQHLIDTWAWLAAEFADDPTVVGYDLLNEPNPGLTLLLTDLIWLPEFHRRALNAIRKAEGDGLTKIVFFEPTALWSATSFGLPRPFTSDTQIVYAPHVYAESLTLDRALLGEDLISMRTGFEQARREAAVYGTTFFSGEWGYWGSAEDTAAYMRRYAALEDEFQVGGTMWQWKQACGDPHSVSYPDGAVPDRTGNIVRLDCTDPAEPGGVEIGLVEDTAYVLSRPYPRRFPGTATFAWDPDSRRFTIAGSSEVGADDLEVWIPGGDEPTADLDGLALADLSAVPGGWIATLRPIASSWSAEITHT